MNFQRKRWLFEPMLPSERLVDAVKRLEGFRAATYLDARGIPTIGYGDTGPDVKPGTIISMVEAEHMLRTRLEALAERVSELVTVPINTNELSALCCFTYNVGIGALRNSTLLKKLNAGDISGAAGEFSKWDHCAGKVLPGLTARRAEERAWFLETVASKLQ